MGKENIIQKFVNLESYTSSTGFVGYTEHAYLFNETTCQKAINLFFKVFKLYSNSIYLLSSLWVDSDLHALTKEYDITEEQIKTYIKPLINERVIYSLNYDELGYDYNSEEYGRKLDIISKKFTVVKKNDTNFLNKIFFSVMFISGIKGHCFAVIEEKKLIVYPHDDIGFGFISFGNETEKMNTSKYLKNNYFSKDFKMHWVQPHSI